MKSLVFQYVDEIEREWENMLGHQLPRPLPPFAEFWNALDPIFAWLNGTQPRPSLPRAEVGRNLDPNWRVVEPYSLRRTQDGDLILFVVNDHGALRSYRVDRIAAIRPTTTPFRPKFAVEF